MKFVTLVLACLFAFQAKAALTLNNKPLSEAQTNTIKGFIYEAYISQTPKEQRETLQSIATSIDWVDKLHKSKKVYEITMLKSSEKNTPLILAVTYIIQMVNNPLYNHEPHIKEYYLQLWTDRGLRVRTVSHNREGKKVYSAVLIRKERRKIEKSENNKK